MELSLLFPLVIVASLSAVHPAPVRTNRKGPSDLYIDRLNGSTNLDPLINIIRCGSATESTIAEIGIAPWSVNQDIINENTCPEPLTPICGPIDVDSSYVSPFFEGDIVLDPNTRQAVITATETLFRDKELAKIRRELKRKLANQTEEDEPINTEGTARNNRTTSTSVVQYGNGRIITIIRTSVSTSSVSGTRVFDIPGVSGDVQLVSSGGGTRRQYVSSTSRQISSQTRGKRALVRRPEQRWPDGVVPYTIDDNLPADHKSVIRQAMRHWERNTCVTFEPKGDDQSDHVRFAFYPGCWSFIGRQGGEQILSLGYSCNTMRTVVHEMGHAIGLWHEQSRRDRDKYIKVVNSNLAPGTEDNFNKIDVGNITSLGYPYDFDSIMHYDAMAFTKNGRITLKVKKDYRNIPTTDLGMKNRLSDLDIAQVNAMYECNQRREVPTDCFESDSGNGREYRGDINFTEDFVTCQMWSAQWPNKHDQYSVKTRQNERNGLGEHNYCRNPGGKRKRPWCFTTRKKTRWQFCPITLC